MEKTEKNVELDTISYINQMEFSESNFSLLQNLCVQQIKEIKSLSIQVDKFIEDSKSLKNSLSRTEKKVKHLDECTSVILTKIKALKIEKKYLKKRLKLNNNSFD